VPAIRRQHQVGGTEPQPEAADQLHQRLADIGGEIVGLPSGPLPRTPDIMARGTAVEGTYDPVEQIWRLADGTPLTDPKVGEILDELNTETHCWVFAARIPDDLEIDSA
jgi:hypothetical protein